MFRGPHWDDVYARRDASQLSWFEAVPEQSLRFIADSGVAEDAAIIDVGGGTSSLAIELARRGYTDVTVADISAVAMRIARERIPAGCDIRCVAADVRAHDFGRKYELWHDRAAFHFMVDEADRDAYLQTLRHSLRRGGTLVLATFGPDGPPECSGLPTARYESEELAAAVGSQFTLLAARMHEHTTPSGARQQFLYTRFSRH